MFNQEKINVLKQEFLDKADNFISLIEFSKKAETNFLSVKLAFMAFLGAVFAIIFSKIEVFGKNFLIAFFIIVILSFVLLIYNLWLSTKDIENSLKKQYKRTILAKIRHIAAMEKDIAEMKKYGEDAEKILFENEKTRQQMRDKFPINEIIKYPENNWEWKVDFILWTIVFLSVPVLFLLRILNVL